MNELIGLANNTKWRESQALMSSLGIKAPCWQTLAAIGFLYPTEGRDADWTYHFCLGEYKDIEWCETSPRDLRGAL